MATIKVLRAKSVLEQFREPTFRAAWEQLYTDCPWATVYQTISFAEVWYETYSDTYEAVAVVSQDGNCLNGVFTIAHEKSTGTLVQCGCPQSEYGIWMTRPGEDAGFLKEAIPAIWAIFPDATLRLAFTPPDAPLELLSRFPAAVAVPHPCGLRTTNIEAANESLGKSANRSKLKRLGASGPVELVELSSRHALAKHIDVVAQHCDLRQGAINGSLPFQEDPHKREFFLRLADTPGILHSVALMAGQDLAAFHAGFLSRDREHIGLISHSPFLAKHSPGKLMLLMLIKNLGEKGLALLDLTPGGAYKERFQDSETTSYIVIFFASIGKARTYRAKLALRGYIKRLMAQFGLDPAQTEQKVTKLRPRSLLGSIVNVVRNRLKRSHEMRFYRIDMSAAAELKAALKVQFNVNNIADLLLYKQAAPGERSKQTFLRQCLQRMEAGETIYTYAENDRLLHFAWVAKRHKAAPSGLGTSVFFPPKSLVLWDDYTDPAARGRGLHKASIAARALEALETGAGVYINVDAENTPSRKNIERLGFVHLGSVHKVGSRVWTEPVPSALLPDGFFH